ncbi:MAG: hypothetical protein RDU89_02925 [bacterium]|nr:hypothetical protein [bacterium]
MRQVFVAALVGLALVLASGPALACGTGWSPYPAAIRPLQPTLVTLETLDIRFRVLFNGSEVEAVFTLSNMGPATTVLMGFAEEEPPTKWYDPVPHDFRAFVDGLEVPVRRDPDLVPEPPGDAVAWYVWEVNFAAGQTRQVRYIWWSHHAGYYLRPAAAWHGSIGRVRVLFELASYLPYVLRVHVAYPLDPRYRFEGDNVVWECHDLEFEPGHGGIDLGLTISERLLNNVQDTPGAYASDLAWQWEALSRAGSYEELLTEVEKHRHDEGMKANPFLVPLYEARAQNGLGRTEDAVQNWHRILELTLPPDDPYWRLHPAQDEAYYHLVRYYHAAGDQDRVVELYRELKHRPLPRHGEPPFVLLQWMQSMLPSELRVGVPPTVAAVLLPEEPPSYSNETRSYSLTYHAQDADGDLIRVGWSVWHTGDDPEHPAAKGGWETGPRGKSSGSLRVWVRPHERVWYRVDAVDLKGNRGSTGILEYVPRTTPAAPGDGPVTPAANGDGPVTPAAPGDGPVTPAGPGDEPATPAGPGDEPVTPAGPGDEPVAPDPPRRSAWRLVGWGMLAAALVMAWRRRRARSLRAGPGA